MKPLEVLSEDLHARCVMVLHEEEGKPTWIHKKSRTRTIYDGDGKTETCFSNMVVLLVHSQYAYTFGIIVSHCVVFLVPVMVGFSELGGK
ncbi:hypothetical protein F2Q69_00009602 [Brassica cretica]|uniref:Uncharacterized protein n=2 Tax=Brassica cretica TaxID=69181 RepID=A0ABQ7CKP0_BRACR|nr:hypothetical protein F2Q69_00009602 [Brassica cretica]KAF3551758.1 hypothetical protein DY000_02009988 [Brassica cretica]